MLSTRLTLLIVLITACMVSACSNSRHLPKGDSLFRGSKVHIKDNEASHTERKILINDLTGLVRPKPNSKFLGVRLKLGLYNFAGETKKKKGIRHWLRDKVGEPPVLLSTVNVKANKDLMVNLLENRGFFYPAVSSHTDTAKNRKSTIVFDVTTGPQYHINKVLFMRDSSEVAYDVDSLFFQTLLKEGAPYNLDLIKAERQRMDHGLKEMGYYFFKPDYVLVIADTSIGDHKVNMYVTLKSKEIPDEAYNVYKIDNIYIYANYKLQGKNEDTSKANKVKVGSFYVIDKQKVFKPGMFKNVMVFETGDDYNIDDQNTSLSRIVNLGVFKFVKNRFEPTYDSMMDVYYYLTPAPKKSLRFETGVLTGSDNRAGTEASISWRNRNAFKGAEELRFKINGGIEAQYGGGQNNSIYQFGTEADLSFPRFVVPFIKIKNAERTLPRSVIKLKYNYESEANLLRINSYTASYGYVWKVGIHKQHQFFPFNFTYVKTDTLGDPSRLKLLYGNLVFNGIIVGPTYEYTYSSRTSSSQKSSFYFDGLVDLSGNILGLAQQADYRTNPMKLFGVTYAQYVKLQPDFRYYYNVSSVSTIASRIMAGIGIPYGNSGSLPNIKQFWAGGNSDLRGFPSRLVGPGTYNNSVNGGNYIETLGDLKLEGNVELRQNLYKFIKLGVFVDAGNMWLYHDNPALPGGAFTSNFYKEFAVDAGLGPRFDFDILILRIDVGMPIREPWLPENDRWVFNKINFANPSWRSNNLVFNIAIGYPF
jgi:outer membrane protein insertion porin family